MSTSSSAIANVAGSNSGSNSSSSSSSMASLSDNYEMFLQLLTTQLKNQSPLDPMNADQFTSQLVQYSSVEQLIKLNTNFTDLKSSMESSNLAALVNYVGTTVTVDTSTQPLESGKATWTVNAEKAASKVTLTVKNSDGDTVYTKDTTLSEGENTFTWDGSTIGGKTLTSGDYTLSVSARSASGSKVTTTVDVTGKVTSLDWTDGTPYLTIDGVKYPTSAVTKISASN